MFYRDYLKHPIGVHPENIEGFTMYSGNFSFVNIVDGTCGKEWLTYPVARLFNNITKENVKSKLNSSSFNIVKNSFITSKFFKETWVCKESFNLHDSSIQYSTLFHIGCTLC